MTRTALALAVSAVVLGGCSAYQSIGAAPTLAVGDGGRAGGASFEGAQGLGAASERAASFVEWRLRGVVTKEHQQLAALVGVSRYHRIGSSFAFWPGLDVGFGPEHTPSTWFFDSVLQGRLMGAIVLREDQRLVPGVFSANRVRETTFLTFGPVADGDLRFTRDAFYTFSFAIGVAFTDELGIQ